MEGNAITRNQYDYIWQDREIKFDCKAYFLSSRKGEMLIGK